ncbi:MAG: iron-sulfur cluster assembly accessory protein [Spirosomataceae bacterium]
MMSNPPIRISAVAQKEITDTLLINKIPTEYGLRVGVKGGGCSAQFLLGFDLPTPNDHIYIIDSIKVIIDKKHLMYVIGTEVDFEENEESTGFTIIK